MAGRLLVIAGDVRQYRRFCRENHLHPRRGARYVSSIQDVRGPSGFIAYVRVGTYAERWRDSEELGEIFAYLRHRGAVDVTGLSEARLSDDEFSMAFGQSSGPEPV